MATPPPDAENMLPVMEAKGAIVKLVQRGPACVIVGETGSGKTTQVPQFLWDHVVKPKRPQLCVGVTQPRRVAAVSIARYVASQRGCTVGGEVGYAVRFDDQSSAATRIKFMTDGILLREIQSDAKLTKYAVIVLDEAHERTLHGDVLFGLLKSIVRDQRPDLKIVVMSATLNSEQFSKFWFNAPVGVVHGRAFPVVVMHAVEPQLDYLEAAITTVLRIHCEEGPGDVLCFLTGQEEIEDSKRILTERMKMLPNSIKDFYILTLYSAMPYEQQLAVFDKSPNGQRKVILTTNIAETSITVEGVKFVVDCGCVKAKSFSAKTGLESLQEIDISKAQATQRTGRAGRMSAGKCFRLFTEAAFSELSENTVPEIKRCSLTSVVLQMKGLGIVDCLDFEFMDKPPLGSITKAEEVLYSLGALDSQLHITPLGRRMNDFPVEPSAAKALLAGQALNVGNDMVIVIAMLSTENIFLTSAEHRDNAEKCKGQFATSVGDHATYLRLFHAYHRLAKTNRRAWCEGFSINFRQMQKVEDTCVQLSQILGAAPADGTWFGIEGNAAKRPRSEDQASGPASNDFELVRRAICFGYCLNFAFFDARAMCYKTGNSLQVVNLHPTSVLFNMAKKKPQLLIFNNVVNTTKNFMKDVSVVREEWLHQAAPHVFAKTT